MIARCSPPRGATRLASSSVPSVIGTGRSICHSSRVALAGGRPSSNDASLVISDILSDGHPLYPRHDAGGHVVVDRPPAPSQVVGADRLVTLAAQQHGLVAHAHAGHVAHADHYLVHA